MKVVSSLLILSVHFLPDGLCNGENNTLGRLFFQLSF